jgi:hypothetical protein
MQCTKVIQEAILLITVKPMGHIASDRAFNYTKQNIPRERPQEKVFQPKRLG